MIYIMCLLISVSVAGVVLAIKAKDYSPEANAALGVVVVSSIILFFCSLAFISNYRNSVKTVQENKATQQTLDKSRAKGFTQEAERVEAIGRIIDHNSKLATAQYWNNNWFFDSMIDDTVDKIKPVE